MKKGRLKKSGAGRLRLAAISGMEISMVDKPYRLFLKKERSGRWYRWYIYKKNLNDNLEQKTSLYFTEKEINDHLHINIFSNYEIV